MNIRLEIFFTIKVDLISVHIKFIRLNSLSKLMMVHRKFMAFQCCVGSFLPENKEKFSLLAGVCFILDGVETMFRGLATLRVSGGNRFPCDSQEVSFTLSSAARKCVDSCCSQQKNFLDFDSHI